MADFVAVIRKAVDNLSDNSPENRAKIYEKARAAIRRQLEAMTPRPADEMIDRQINKLDEAIAEVDSEYVAALPADEEETDRLMNELEALVEEKGFSDPVPEAPAQTSTAPSPAPVSAPVPTPDGPDPSQPVFAETPVVPSPEVQDAAQSEAARSTFDDAVGEFQQSSVDPVAPAAARAIPGAPSAYGELTGVSHDEAFGLGDSPSASASDNRPPAKPTAQPASGTRQRKRSSSMGWVALLAILLLVAGAGYAAWTQKDALMAMFSSDSSGSMTAVGNDAGSPAVETPKDTASEVPAEKPETEIAAISPDQPVKEADGKFTQRLGPDGTETDPGPAPSTSDAGPVEGRSVAAQTGTGTATETQQPEVPKVDAVEGTDTAEELPEETDPGVRADEPLGVAQKMFLYEERLDQQSPAVTEGTVAWSAIADPDNGGANNLAIRGEISTSVGFSALITIKRNTDQSLPASHIIEVVFALSPEFSGGSISQLQRVSMKQTEQDQGNPLIAVPAQITPDFYMIALNDLAEAVDSNLQLLRDRNWIDIPVVYSNGRRALITIEKGASGSEVFNQVLDVWAAG